MRGGMFLVWSWASAMFAVLGGVTWLVLRMAGRGEDGFFRKYLLKGVLVLLVLVPAALGPPAFGLSLATFACVFAHEVTGVLGRVTPRARNMRWVSALGPAFLCLVTASAVRPAPWWLLVLLGLIPLALPWSLLHARGSMRAAIALFLCAIWPGLSLFGTSWLVTRDNLLFDVAFLFGVLEVNAALGSLVSRLWGHHPIAPELHGEHRAQHTWEGVFAGLAGAALAGFMLSFCQPRFSPLVCVLLGLILALLGNLSDLTANLLKRIARVRGFGSWLGPHGGFMDAYESFVLVAPLWCALLSSV